MSHTFSLVFLFEAKRGLFKNIIVIIIYSKFFFLKVPPPLNKMMLMRKTSSLLSPSSPPPQSSTPSQRNVFCGFNKIKSNQKPTSFLPFFFIPNGRKKINNKSKLEAAAITSEDERGGRDIFADLTTDSSSFGGSSNSGGDVLEKQQLQISQQISQTKNVLKVFSGSAHPELSMEIANYLGMDLGKLTIKKFADGEIYVQINESIRGSDVFLVQPTCPPTNDNIMELLVMIDACRRASCRSITTVIPYFGYARADRRTAGRESIAAKLVANLLTQAGATRVVLMDIHSLQTIGYYDIPVDHIYGETVILDYLTSKDFRPDEVVVVSPDVGGVPRARAFAKKLADAPLAIIDKRRTGHNKAQVMNLIGDVEGKVCVMLDDMIDTGGTLLAGAELCRTLGARDVYACATHAVFSPPAVERLGSGAFTEVIVTNSIPHTQERDFAQLTVLSVGNLLGETIWRVHNDTPVSFNKL